MTHPLPVSSRRVNNFDNDPPHYLFVRSYWELPWHLLEPTGVNVKWYHHRMTLEQILIMMMVHCHPSPAFTLILLQICCDPEANETVQVCPLPSPGITGISWISWWSWTQQYTEWVSLVCRLKWSQECRNSENFSNPRGESRSVTRYFKRPAVRWDRGKGERRRQRRRQRSEGKWNGWG